MSRSEFDQDDPSPEPPREGLFTGIAGAILVDTMFNVPAVFVMPLIKPANVALAVGKLLLSVNMLVGYAGGRIAARAGMAHDDSRSQWTAAIVVTFLSELIATIAQQIGLRAHLIRMPSADVQNAAERVSGLEFTVMVVLVMLLVRFGFAMGTWSQAKREGRVRDEDEASVE